MKKLVCCFLIISAMIITASVDAKEKQGQGEGSGSATDSSGVETGISPAISGEFTTDQLSTEQLTITSNCTSWWLWSQNKWKWNGIPGLYVSYESYAKSWTEYGTTTAPCGIPLTVDRLYVSVREFPLQSPYTFYEKTAYNTNFVDKGNSGWCANCTNLCGVKSGHSATKNGITWSATVKSGCAY